MDTIDTILDAQDALAEALIWADNAGWDADATKQVQKALDANYEAFDKLIEERPQLNGFVPTNNSKE